MEYYMAIKNENAVNQYSEIPRYITKLKTRRGAKQWIDRT